MSKITFSDSVNNISPNPANFVFRMKYDPQEIISLAGGSPSFPIPERVWEQLVSQAKKQQNYVTYPTDFKGDIELRRLVANDLSEEFGYAVDPEEILITVGANSAIFSVLYSLVNAGDSVIFANPGFSTTMGQIELMRAKVKLHPLAEKNDWNVNLSVLQKQITKNSKVFFFSDPSNPTGSIIPWQTKRELLALAQERGLLVVADETYRHIIYPEHQFVSVGNFAKYRRNMVVIRSFSKDFSMAGYRLGFVFAPKELINQFLQVHLHINFCASNIAQQIAKLMYQDKNAVYTDNNKFYLANRNLICERLDKLNDIFSYVKPMGGYFIFPQLVNKLDSMAAYKILLAEAKVMARPGIAFGPYGEKHLRMSFTGGASEINNFFDRVEKVRQKL